MSPGEHRLLAFVVDRIESMLQRPGMWGSLQSVEDQLLQLLELRRVLLVPSTTEPHIRQLMQAYVAFIAVALGHRSPEPLATQLERLGRANEFSTLFGKFVEHELAMFVTEQHTASNADEPVVEAQIDATARVIEYLRLDIEGKQPGTSNTAIEFSVRS